ncbi:unnamed protein product [Spirodela intermedia]|uniref:Uncharacterized protein n=1 Tax=Spirodela intermedia TaxID=51605 RepID=A0A7I8J954_SPIIN|nr:unnamed protein product [Spirodela intermedia]CAA6665982.1 unnamed protein product [Spirodela intermedia]
MGDEKSLIPMGSRERERDRELLIPAFYKVFRSWASKKFMTGCVILFPIAITFYITWWFIHFVDGFFSPIFVHLGINMFDQNTQAFKEVAIIRHPRIGEYALGFITSSVVLQTYSGEEQLCCVYVPTNHLYIGDIFLINSADVIRPNLSVREGIEIVVSGGMSMPQILSTLDSPSIQVDRTRWEEPEGPPLFSLFFPQELWTRPVP